MWARCGLSGVVGMCQEVEDVSVGIYGLWEARESLYNRLQHVCIAVPAKRGTVTTRRRALRAQSALRQSIARAGVSFFCPCSNSQWSVHRRTAPRAP